MDPRVGKASADEQALLKLGDHSFQIQAITSDSNYMVNAAVIDQALEDKRAELGPQASDAKVYAPFDT